MKNVCIALYFLTTSYDQVDASLRHMVWYTHTVCLQFAHITLYMIYTYAVPLVCTTNTVTEYLNVKVTNC